MKIKHFTMGIIATILLVLLLAQSNYFRFLTETYLGRIIVITFIIFIATSNKILGLLSILTIILAFNYNELNVVQSYNYYEGFESSTGETKKPSSATAKPANEEESVVTKTTTQITTIDKPTKKTSEAREGFCMSDKELNVLRGKPSNVVPVFDKYRKQSDDVEPTNNSIFSNLYSSANIYE